MRIVCLLVLLVFSGCGSAGSNDRVVNSVDATANQATTANINVSPTASVSPLTVTIDSPDGLRVVGSFYESSKPGSPAVLLLHQWQSDRHSYDDFAKRLQTKGFNVLAIDGRGFGESVKTTDGRTVEPERTDDAVKAMLGDVGAAFEFLSKQKNVDPNQIGVVGASYGSSLAIIYAADDPRVKAVALLSPGLNYFGNMQTRPAVEKYGNRDLFIVASKGDTESAQAVEGLTIGNVRHGFMVLPVGTYHGTDLFKYRDKTNGPPVVEDAVESFLMTRLGLAKADYK
jgi:dienelactone hydrolase